MQTTPRDAGIEAVRQGEWQAAAGHLLQAVRQNPTDAAALGYLGIALGQLGAWSDAAVALRHAVRLSPDAAGLHYNLGQALEQQAEVASAAQSYRRTVELDPGHARARDALRRLESSSVSAPADPASPAAAIAGTAPAAPPPPGASPTGEHTAPVVTSASAARAGAPVAPVKSPAPKAALAVVAAAVIILGSLAGLTWAGRAMTTRLREPPSSSAPAATPAAAIGLPAPDHPVVTGISPVSSGPGILICDPVKSGGSLDYFGAGCGRWLQLVVGGHGELGKTPLWSHLEHTLPQIDKQFGSLDLSLEQAVELPRSLGITHVAVGKITGDEERCTLAYQVWTVPEKAAVGSPLSLTGTAAEVLAGLPGLARQIAGALGVVSPRVPAAVGETAAELDALGYLPIVVGAGTTGEMQKFLAVAMEITGRPGSRSRPHPPILAAFLHLMYSGSREDRAEVRTLAGNLTRTLPDNALVLGEIGRQAFRSGEPGASHLPVVQLEQNLARFPNNLLFQTASSYFNRVGHRMRPARDAANHAVRCSPSNPNAWRLLGEAISDAATSIQRERSTRPMTQRELAAVMRLYEEALPVTVQVVTLDPEHALGWMELSESAAFLGKEELADQALWRALDLNPRDHRFYSWGLQLYQPKWLGDLAKLKKIARMAVEASADPLASWSPRERLELAFQIHTHVSPELAGEMRLPPDGEAALQERVRAHERSQAGSTGQ